MFTVHIEQAPEIDHAIAIEQERVNSRAACSGETDEYRKADAVPW